MRCDVMLCVMLCAMILVSAASSIAWGGSGDAASPGPVDQHPAEHLRAGPISVKFQDGQLRYIRVGEVEIARRIYFGVRDGNWATAMPNYTHVDVQKFDDHFIIKLAAHCKMGPVDYNWDGTITGTPEGKITFEAGGAANADFDSNRIGLCFLYGTPALAGHAFTTDGQGADGRFPRLVSPKLVASQFKVLRYATPGGITVTTQLEGATFDMEDQRNWGDSSWKAYAPLPYAYKHVGKGDAKRETITLSVSGAAVRTREMGRWGEREKGTADGAIHVKLGRPIALDRIPKLSALEASAAGQAKTPAFFKINFDRDAYAGQKEIDWSYTPTTHLPDDDTIRENLPAIIDQANTLRSISPSASLKVWPLHLPPHAADRAIAAAWAAAMVQPLSIAGVEEARFAPLHNLQAVLDAFAPCEGKSLVAVQTTPACPSEVKIFAAQSDHGVALFLINLSPEPAQIVVDDLTGHAVDILVAGALEQSAPIPAGAPTYQVKADLAPFSVLRMTIRK